MDSSKSVKDQATDCMKEAVLIHLRNNEQNKLFFALAMGGIDPLFSKKAVFDNHDPDKQTLETEIVVDTLVNELRSKFRFVDLKNKHTEVVGTLGKGDLQKFDELAEIAFYFKVFSLALLVRYYDQDVAVTNQYKSILVSKKRQLVRFSKWGDIDNSAWVNVIQEFAIEKLHCGQVDSAIASFPDHIKDHVSNAWVGPCSRAFVISCLLKELNESSDNDLSKGHSTSNYKTIETGEDYEGYIQQLIQENVPGVTIQLTPKTGDQGADLIVCGSKVKIVVQAKYYGGKVGNTAVQEVTAAKSYYRADVSIVVTNSEYTDSARRLA